jgi:hypothetical protein
MWGELAHLYYGYDVSDEKIFLWLPSSLTMGVMVNSLISLFVPVKTAESLGRKAGTVKIDVEAGSMEVLSQSAWPRIDYPSTWICVWMKGLY